MTETPPLRLSVAYEFLPQRRSLGTSIVMDQFGVDFTQGQHVIAEGVELDPPPAGIVLFTGPSGSGKSSLLRAAAAELERRPDRPLVVWIDRLHLPELPLVDGLPVPVAEALDLLAACGLGEAQLLLRQPSELSDGQRYRFRIALALAILAERSAGTPGWLVADEFAALLDRTLAKVLAFNLRRLARRRQVGFLLATAHDDLTSDLAPDVLVCPDLDGQIRVERQAEAGVRRVSFFGTVGTARAPVPTGLTSPLGTTAPTPSDS